MADSFDFSGWYQRLLEEIDRAMESTARFIPVDVHQKIIREQKPDGSAQKQNAESTRHRKKRLYGEAIPLIGDDRHLMDPTRYDVQQVGLCRWMVSLPPDRGQVVQWLRARGYGVFEMSAEIRAHLDRALADAMAAAEGAVPGYRR